MFAIQNKFKKTVATILLLVLVAGSLLYLFKPKHDFFDIKIGSKEYNLEAVYKPKDMEKGLSGRDALVSDGGMLFVFPDEGESLMWMKDMRFPLDILWLDSAGKVVYLKENISPDTYPLTFGKGVNSSFVIELGAGEISLSGISVGDTVNISGK